MQIKEFGGPEVLEWIEVDVPNPGPGQLLVRHTFSEKYRYKFRFEEDGKLRFRNETIKYLKIGFFYGFTYGFIMGTIIGPFGSQNGI